MEAEVRRHRIQSTRDNRDRKSIVVATISSTVYEEHIHEPAIHS
jgi:hypothetical protein